MRSVSERIELIATRTGKMAMLEIANSQNPDFMELMKLQEQLVAAADILIEKYSKLDPEAFARVITKSCVRDSEIAR